jgi:hypothetical protein
MIRIVLACLTVSLLAPSAMAAPCVAAKYSCTAWINVGHVILTTHHGSPYGVGDPGVENFLGIRRATLGRFGPSTAKGVLW